MYSTKGNEYVETGFDTLNAFIWLEIDCGKESYFDLKISTGSE
jgi:hypothetical protein